MNIAEVTKKQTDSIIQHLKQSSSGGLTIDGSGESVVSKPYDDLATHKTSADHDSRYYTQDEVDDLLAAMPTRYTQAIDNEDSIVVEHNLGRKPLTQVIGSEVSAFGEGLYGDGPFGGIGPLRVLIPGSIVHNSEDQLTITLSEAATGEVVCIG